MSKPTEWIYSRRNFFILTECVILYFFYEISNFFINFVWGLNCSVAGCPHPPIIDSRGGWLPVECLSQFFVSSVSSALYYYRLCCFTHLLNSRTPFRLEAPVFFNCRPSRIHNPALRNWICPHRVRTVVDPKEAAVSSHLTDYLRLLTMNSHLLPAYWIRL